MEMPELKLLPEVGITWIDINDSNPDIITRERVYLVYSNSAGTDFAYWNKRSGKFLSESMGIAYDLPITHWAALPDGPNT